MTSRKPIHEMMTNLLQDILLPDFELGEVNELPDNTNLKMSSKNPPTTSTLKNLLSETKWPHAVDKLRQHNPSPIPSANSSTKQNHAPSTDSNQNQPFAHMQPIISHQIGSESTPPLSNSTPYKPFFSNSTT